MKKKCKRCEVIIPSRITYCTKCQDHFKSNTKRWKNETLGTLQARRVYQSNSQIRDDARVVVDKQGWVKCCAVCEYSLHVQVCHVKAIKDHTPDTIISAINDPSNLILLCSNHHWEFDHGLLDIKEIRARQGSNLRPLA